MACSLCSPGGLRTSSRSCAHWCVYTFVRGAHVMLEIRSHGVSIMAAITPAEARTLAARLDTSAATTDAMLGEP